MSYEKFEHSDTYFKKKKKNLKKQFVIKDENFNIKSSLFYCKQCERVIYFMNFLEVKCLLYRMAFFLKERKKRNLF